MTFAVGAFWNLAVGEYSILIRPLPRTSNRASPARMVAPGLAWAAEKSIGVDRLTGDAGDVAAAWLAPAMTIVAKPTSAYTNPATSRRLCIASPSPESAGRGAISPGGRGLSFRAGSVPPAAAPDTRFSTKRERLWPGSVANLTNPDQSCREACR
jgi:hypothetical protein